jgi:hypothetical protein
MECSDHDQLTHCYESGRQEEEGNCSYDPHRHSLLLSFLRYLMHFLRQPFHLVRGCLSLFCTSVLENIVELCISQLVSLSIHILECETYQTFSASQQAK